MWIFESLKASLSWLFSRGSVLNVFLFWRLFFHMLDWVQSFAGFCHSAPLDPFGPLSCQAAKVTSTFNDIPKNPADLHHDGKAWAHVLSQTPTHRLLVRGLRVHLWLGELAGGLSQVTPLLTQHLLQLCMELLLLHLQTADAVRVCGAGTWKSGKTKKISHQQTPTCSSYYQGVTWGCGATSDSDMTKENANSLNK